MLVRVHAKDRAINLDFWDRLHNRHHGSITLPGPAGGNVCWTNVTSYGTVLVSYNTKEGGLHHEISPDHLSEITSYASWELKYLVMIVGDEIAWPISPQIQTRYNMRTREHRLEAITAEVSGERKHLVSLPNGEEIYRVEDDIFIAAPLEWPGRHIVRIPAWKLCKVRYVSRPSERRLVYELTGDRFASSSCQPGHGDGFRLPVTRLVGGIHHDDPVEDGCLTLVSPSDGAVHSYNFWTSESRTYKWEHRHLDMPMVASAVVPLTPTQRKVITGVVSTHSPLLVPLCQLIVGML